jgi:hypothetical protein
LRIVFFLHRVDLQSFKFCGKPYIKSVNEIYTYNKKREEEKYTLVTSERGKREKVKTSSKTKQTVVAHL